MYCKKCGSLLNDGAAFCPNCGQTMAAKPAAPAAEVNAIPPRQPMYGSYPQQPGHGYYGNQQYGKTNASGTSVKGLFMIAMAVLLVILSVGLAEFPVAKYGSDWFYSVGNGSAQTYIQYLYFADGDFFEAINNIVDNGELGGVCMIISWIMMCLSVLIAVVGFLCTLVKRYYGAAVTMGIGLLSNAVGYLALFVAGIYMVSQNSDSTFSKAYISVVPPAMFIVCIGLAIIAFVSAGRIRNSD